MTKYVLAEDVGGIQVENGIQRVKVVVIVVVAVIAWDRVLRKVPVHIPVALGSY